MPPNVRKWFDLPRLLHNYKRRMPLILINGLAEQPESWFANRNHFARQFDVKIPEILVYDGDALHRHIDSGAEVTVDYLAERLAVYLDEFVQRPPYHLVGSSLGCQVILTYATRYPERVSKLVLICPSGFHGDENLPAMEGVRRSQYDTLVKSVFHKGRFASDDLVKAFERKFQDRKMEEGGAAHSPGHGGALRGAALAPGSPPDAGHLGRVRPGALRRSRRDPRGRPDPQGPPGGHSQVRSCSPDREGPAGQPACGPLPQGQAQGHSPRT